MRKADTRLDDAALAEALDQCLTRLARGETLAGCLRRYPQYAAELRPLLEAGQVLRDIAFPEARAPAYETGRAKMMAAVSSHRWPRRAVRAAQRAASPRPARAFGAVPVFARVAIGVAMVALLAIGFLFARNFLAGPRPAQAVVAETAGVVLRLKQGSRTWEPLAVGDTVAEGERVQTGTSGAARLMLSAATSAMLSPDSEMVVVALRAATEATAPEVEVYQERGEVDYTVTPVAEPAPGTAQGELQGTAVGQGDASPPAGTQAAMRGETLRVHSASAEAVATSAAFTFAVSKVDSATDVAVRSGEVSVSAGATTEVALPGEVTMVAAANTEPPTTVPWEKIPPGHWWAPGWLRHQDQEEEQAEATATPVPPGLEDKGGTPPGQQDRIVPPGQEDKSVPPGLEDKGGLPPGQEDKDDKSVPPGLEDKGGLPPGQQKDKDK